MARTNTAFAPLSIILLAGAGVLLFFVVLSSISSTSPLRQTYFLQADTSGISGARPVSQWTFFRVCGEGNTDCSRSWPDYPVGWAWSKNPTGDNLPTPLIGSLGNGTTSKTYFYLWRFGWVFYLLALFFTVIAFFAGFVACCGRLGSAVAGLVSAFALFCHTVAAALMTATFVRMRDQFVSVGRNAQIGRYAFGFTWGAWAALFIATVLLFLGARGRKDTYAVANGTSGGRTSARSRWGRKRSVRSRRSYEMGTHRVKDDYN